MLKLVDFLRGRWIHVLIWLTMLIVYIGITRINMKILRIIRWNNQSHNLEKRVTSEVKRVTTKLLKLYNWCSFDVITERLYVLILSPLLMLKFVPKSNITLPLTFGHSTSFKANKYLTFSKLSSCSLTSK